MINTRDVITFQGESVGEIKKAFIDSVKDYLEFCKERCEEPEKPFSGKLSLRLEHELHRKVFTAAKIEHKSINSWITETLKQAVDTL